MGEGNESRCGGDESGYGVVVEEARVPANSMLYVIVSAPVRSPLESLVAKHPEGINDLKPTGAFPSNV